MTLMNFQQAQKRYEQKRIQILKMLLTETWTHHDNICQLLNVKTKYPVLDLLERLKFEQLIKSHTIKFSYIADIKLWGITDHGIGMTSDDYDVDYPGFQPSMVKISTMQHHLELQLVKILLERSGMKVWDRYKKYFIKNSKYPDAIVTDQDNGKIAIEMERNFKSTKRYRDILISHLKSRKKEDWKYILYVTPEPKLCARVKKSFSSIGYATYKGYKFKVTDEEHLKYFKFTDIASLKNGNFKF